GGRVQWPEGDPADARLAVAGPNERLFKSEVHASKDGAFRVIGLGNGPYRVVALDERSVYANGEKTVEHWFAEQAEVEPGTLDLVLTLARCFEVSGLVVDEAGTRLDDFAVSARGPGAGWHDGPDESFHGTNGVPSREPVTLVVTRASTLSGVVLGPHG